MIAIVAFAASLAVFTPSASPVAPGTTAPPTASALPTESPAPASPAGPASAPAPLPSEMFTYRFVPHQPATPAAGVPQIFAVYLNDKTLHSLGPILIKVSTDPGTVKVINRANGRDNLIPMIGPGDFEAVGKLPKVPFIASGMTIMLQFIAVGPTGERVSVKVPVELK